MLIFAVQFYFEFFIRAICSKSDFFSPRIMTYNYDMSKKNIGKYIKRLIFNIFSFLQALRHSTRADTYIRNLKF